MAPRKRKVEEPPQSSKATTDGGQSPEPSNSGSRTRMKKKGRWWHCGPIKFFALVFLAMFLLNYASLKQEYKYLMPTGDLVDIGWGQRLFYRCTGKGEPVIILDAPAGETSDIWIHVETQLSKYNKVCVYDRAGLGFSDIPYKNTSEYANDYSKEARFRDGLQPGTVDRMADDLHRLLRSITGSSPVILVSSDFSTLVSRFYALLYEENVKGLFLIDPMVETLFDDNSTWLHHWYEEAVPHVNMLYLGGVIGFNRIALMIGAMKPTQNKDILKHMTTSMINRKKYFLCSSSHLSSVLNEVYLANISVKQVKTMFKVKPFPRHIPITIATYEQAKYDTNRNNLTSLWLEGQDILMELIHPSAQQASLPGAHHDMFYTNPQPVVNAIDKFVRQIRTSSGS